MHKIERVKTSVIDIALRNSQARYLLEIFVVQTVDKSCQYNACEKQFWITATIIST